MLLVYISEHNVIGDLHIEISFERKEAKINDLFKLILISTYLSSNLTFSDYGLSSNLVLNFLVITAAGTDSNC